MTDRFVCKYEIKDSTFELELPEGANIVDLQQQGDKACLWIAQNTGGNFKMERRRFSLVGTGVEWDSDEWTYLKTFHQSSHGEFYVWHLLEGS